MKVLAFLVPGAIGMATTPMLGSLIVGPVQFDAPTWLWLIPILWALSVWIGLKNLSGLGHTTRWTVLAIRLLVILLISAALAEPQWRKVAKDVAVTMVLDTSQSVPGKLQRDVEQFVSEARQANMGKHPNDRLGYLTVAKDGFVQSLPTRGNDNVERQHTGKLDQTNLAGGVNLALAVKPTDAAYRIVLASDGLETSGSLLQAAEAARALGVPIDVLPLRFRYDAEVVVDRVVVPSNAREGESVTVRVILNSTRAAKGRIALLVNGTPVDLGGVGGASAPMTLEPGVNVKSLAVPAMARGALQFQAIFMPEASAGQASNDEVAENNRAEATTFVGGEGRALVIASGDLEARNMLDVLQNAKIKADVFKASEGPQTLAEFNAYDVVILVNQAADEFSQQQQEELKRYVYDSGGGLVMVGGDRSFGAGGWIGSPLEDALPVRLDPPQKREMPKGALVLVVHSVEMPEGVFWGKKTATAAVNTLSRLDKVGINEYTGNYGGLGASEGVEWVHELQAVGDGTRVKRAINNLRFGDMPSFFPSIQMSYDALMNAKDAGQRHMIVISDGDPSLPPDSLLLKCKKAGITISTVGVFPHSGGDTNNMKHMSDMTGGNHYHVDTQAELANIPQIFIKEARTVRRSLIWEGEPFTPKLVGGVSEAMRGIGGVPPIGGYVVTAEREGLALVTLKGREGDPVMAQWQHGLGKVVAYTSDAATKWNPAWVAWDGFRAFWEQHVRWAMRPTGNANMRVSTEQKGDRSIVTVEALDPKGERLDFAKFMGRVAYPDGTSADVELKQVGPGRYQGTVPSTQSGSSVMSLKYIAPNPDPEAVDSEIEGTVQAAINRPFADEFRTLQDNSAILEQVAGITGGKVLTFDPKAADLWRREGIKMPAPMQSIWLVVATAGLTLFLMDVGVRRVRIEPAMIVGMVRRAVGKGKAKSTEQMDALRAAREQARMNMAKRGVVEGQKAAERALAGEEKSAKVKFEATAEQIRKPSAPVAMGGPDAKPAASSPSAGAAQKGEANKAPAPGEGLGRLMKAKKKAQEGMEEE